MKKYTVENKNGFHVFGDTDKSQAASMVLSPGDKTGGPDNKHQKSDQWLYVVSGKGKAVVNDDEIELNKGSLVLVEAGETHEIINDGKEDLVTLNFYSPPEY